MSHLGRKTQTADGWTLAVELTAGWQTDSGRADWMLEKLPANLPTIERARCQDLFFGAVRHDLRLSKALEPVLRRAPRPKLLAILHVAGAEILENPTRNPALIVDHAVGRASKMCSKAEAGLVNAVMRKIVGALTAPLPEPTGASLGDLSVHFSHPEWLIDRWVRQFGRESTFKLLQWNQAPADVHLRLRPDQAPLPCLEATPWSGFFRVKSGHWADVARLLESGTAYIQDPATRIAPDLLGVQAGAAVLDLCAAPGGKALQLASAAGHGGQVICVDLPGPRIRRLEENVARFRSANPSGSRIEIVPHDILQLAADTLVERKLPSLFDHVLLDAPCSNTGVFRHRVDARWRLEPEDFATQSALQLKLLCAAAAFVAPGGKLVYSTCSLETEENADVVKAFIEAAGARFSLKQRVESRPWESGHDGAGAFLLQRD